MIFYVFPSFWNKNITYFTMLEVFVWSHVIVITIVIVIFFRTKFTRQCWHDINMYINLKIHVLFVLRK
jgi:hypothetical protein